jgi:hypothetical protein
MLYLNFIRLHNANPCLYPTYVRPSEWSAKNKNDTGTGLTKPRRQFHGFSGRPVMSNRVEIIKKEVCFKLHKYDVENAKPRLNGENVYRKHSK